MKSDILKSFGVTENELLGEGGEAWVYALSADKILRIYKNNDLSKNVGAIKKLYRKLDWESVGLESQNILHSDILNGSMYCIEQRLNGQDLSKALPTLKGDDRKKVLDDFYNKAKLIHQLDSKSRSLFGPALHTDQPRSKNWVSFLQHSADKKLSEAFKNNRNEMLQTFVERCRSLNYEGGPKLVHFDYFPTNVMAVGTTISGVIDFSLSIYGDSLIDTACAVGYLGLTDKVNDQDRAYLLHKMIVDYDTRTLEKLTTYLVYVAICWSNCDLPSVAQWAKSILEVWIKTDYLPYSKFIWQAAMKENIES